MPMALAESYQASGDTAAAKASLARRSTGRYLLSAGLAGAYIGVAVVLLFMTSASFVAAQNPATKLVQGSVFGVALTLVVFAGAELFTGCVMTMLHGITQRKVSLGDLLLVWVASWIGNLGGSIAFAALVNGSGVMSAGAPKGDTTVYLATLAGVIHTKVSLTVGQLFLRAVLCNFLVCLGLWMAQRASGDAAKAIVLFWSLLAFIASGFEHSVANMTVFSLAIFAHLPGATAAAMFHNLIWVSLGNIVGGGLLVGVAYAVLGQPLPSGRPRRMRSYAARLSTMLAEPPYPDEAVNGGVPAHAVTEVDLGDGPDGLVSLLDGADVAASKTKRASTAAPPRTRATSPPPRSRGRS